MPNPFLEAHMSPHVLRRSWLLTPLSLVAFAGCQQDVNAPPLKPPAVHFAQGDNGVWTVNSWADPGSGVCDDTECTVREAIAAASTGARIVFAPGLQGDIDLTAGQLQILGKDLRIDGDGRIRVDAQRASRVLSIAGVGPAMGVTLKGITLINGLTAGNGGGLLISDADAVLDHVVVSNNESSAGDGGGIES